MDKIKIFIVDDHKIVRTGIYALLIGVYDIEPIGEAGNAEELFEKIKNKTPNIILLDISLPGMSGIEISKIISEKYPEIKIIILSMNTDENTILSAIKAGVKGFLPKHTSKTELVKAIKNVHAGSEYFGISISETIYKSYAKKLRDGKKDNNNLTEREIEVIKYISDGLSYKEIGLKMFISSRTVESHRNKILSKLKLKTNIDLVKYAVKNHITYL